MKGKIKSINVKVNGKINIYKRKKMITCTE